jgi:hypothetical protein
MNSIPIHFAKPLAMSLYPEKSQYIWNANMAIITHQYVAESSGTADANAAFTAGARLSAITTFLK